MTDFGHRVLAAVCLCAGVAALGACSKKSTTVSTPGGNVTVEQGDNGETTTIKSGQGNVTVGKGAVDAAALGLPIYPGSTPSESGSLSAANTANGESNQVAMLETTAPFETVYDYYKAQMPAGSEKMKMSTGGNSLATFQVGESGSADVKTVMITASQGKVTIELIHATKHQ